MILPYGSRAKQRWEQGSKLTRSLMDLVPWNHLLLIEIPPEPVMKLIQHIFSKILPKFKFEVNFSIQSYASLTREEPAYLQISYHYVYYIKYTELKSFFGHQVWAPKLVDQLLNFSRYIFAWVVNKAVRSARITLWSLW